jgi:hypothetical protein
MVLEKVKMTAPILPKIGNLESIFDDTPKIGLTKPSGYGDPQIPCGYIPPSPNPFFRCYCTGYNSNSNLCKTYCSQKGWYVKH